MSKLLQKCKSAASKVLQSSHSNINHNLLHHSTTTSYFSVAQAQSTSNTANHKDSIISNTNIHIINNNNDNSNTNPNNNQFVDIKNYILPRNVSQLNEIINEKWLNNTYCEEIPYEYLPKIPNNIELEAWECMMLYKINCKHEELGELIIAFPPEGSPSELMKHIHGGGRIITTLDGIGTFGFERNGKWINYECKRGSRVMFPSNTPHTFTGINGSAMLVHALHTPYYLHNDPRAMTYLHCDDNGHSVHSIEYPKWDPKEYFPHILK